MSSRPRMEIRGALILWNATLGVFSIMGALRTWPEFFTSSQNMGYTTLSA